MHNNDQRTMILRAANRVMRKKGLSGATINAIAEEAGLTKGGVLYYFRNKQDILETTITRYAELAAEMHAEIFESLPDEPGRALRASVLTMLALMDSKDEDMHSGVGFLGDPVYRNVVGTMKKQMFNQLAKEVKDKDTLANILFIIDGIWLNKLFSLTDQLGEYEPKMVQILMDMVDECTA